MIKQAILETYSKAAHEKDANLCCSVDYRAVFADEELDHVPAEVLDRNYGCGVPQALATLEPGQNVLDLGPGCGRDCFIAARKVGPRGRVVGLDMNDAMLSQAEHFKSEVVRALGYDNIRFLKGQFDVHIPLQEESVDVIFSNCVNNLAEDKATAYSEMHRVLKPGSRLSFADVVSCEPLPESLRHNRKAWADCVAGVLSYSELSRVLNRAGFHGVILDTQYLWKTGDAVLESYFQGENLSQEEGAQLRQVRLYSVSIEAHKPVVDPDSECYFRGQYALFQGPGAAFQLDEDPEHRFRVGELKEVCEKTATILKSEPFSRHFTVFEPEGEVESRCCAPGEGCC